MYNCKLGKVVKLRSYKGEIVVDTKFANVCIFKELKSVLIDQKEYKIEYFKNLGNRMGLKFVGIDNEAQAKTLVNSYVFYDRSQLKDHQKLTLEEAIDFILIDEEGKVYGKLIDIDNYGAGNLLLVDNGKGDFYLPENKGFITRIDEENKTIFVDKKLIEEVLWELIY